MIETRNDQKPLRRAREREEKGKRRVIMTPLGALINESSQVAQHSYTENMVVSGSQLCTLAGGQWYVVQGQQ